MNGVYVTNKFCGKINDTCYAKTELLIASLVLLTQSTSQTEMVEFALREGLGGGGGTRRNLWANERRFWSLACDHTN